MAPRILASIHRGGRTGRGGCSGSSPRSMGFSLRRALGTLARTLGPLTRVLDVAEGSLDLALHVGREPFDVDHHRRGCIRLVGGLDLCHVVRLVAVVVLVLLREM